MSKSIKSPVLFFLSLFLCLYSQQVCSGSRLLNIEVDASKAVGQFKPLRGANGSPRRINADQKTSIDISTGYRAAKINMVRTHDSVGGDLDPASGSLPPMTGGSGMSPDARKAADKYVIFPDPAADPGKAESYNFGPTDELVGAIHAAGAEVLFRLGRSGMTTAEPPTDLVKYGEIIRHVVLHYNRGWANGFHYNIRYWEVWNEPDLGRIWWTGTPEQYYSLYEAAAKAVKSSDSNALVGGPTIALVNQSTPYREGFLAFVRDHKLPLDFFSWHYYSVDANDPYDFVRIGRSMRGLLDSYGFNDTPSFLDEWNSWRRDAGVAEPINQASFVLSSLIYMQDGNIDQAMLYRADREFGPEGSAPTKLGQGLLAIGRMDNTPVRLQISGGDTNGFAVQAGRSTDGNIIQVLISNYQIAAVNIGPRKGKDVMHEGELFDMDLLPRRTLTYDANGGYNMVIAGLDPDSDYDVERYRITAERDFSLVDTSKAKGAQIRLQAELPPPAIELVVITKHRNPKTHN
jgi:xylan 1,4-beta-xylosidase